MPEGAPPGPRTLALRGVGLLALALAVIGVFLPLLPTTPFVLVSAWAFSRSSPRLRAWLERHPRFGPLLRDWEHRRAIPRSAKLLAAVGLTVSWVLILVRSDQWVLPTVAGLVLAAVGAYVLTRPTV